MSAHYCVIRLFRDPLLLVLLSLSVGTLDAVEDPEQEFSEQFSSEDFPEQLAFAGKQPLPVVYRPSFLYIAMTGFRL